MKSKFWQNVIGGALSLALFGVVSFSASWIRDLSREQVIINERLARIEIKLGIDTKDKQIASTP